MIIFFIVDRMSNAYISFSYTQRTFEPLIAVGLQGPQRQQNCCIRTSRTDSRFAPSQWEMALLCNDVSHWLDANLESALYIFSSSRNDLIAKVDWIHSIALVWIKQWYLMQIPFIIFDLRVNGSDKVSVYKVWINVINILHIGSVH